MTLDPQVQVESAKVCSRLSIIEARIWESIPQIYVLYQCVRIMFYYMHTYLYTYDYIYAYVCSYSCKHIFIHIHIHMHVHVHTHIYIYIYIIYLHTPLCILYWSAIYLVWISELLHAPTGSSIVLLWLAQPQKGKTMQNSKWHIGSMYAALVL